MTKELAAILRARIADVSYIDVSAGLVQVVVQGKPNMDTNQIIAKKMPVSYDLTSGKDPYLGTELALVPNQGKKSISYFEDFGSVPDPVGKAGRLQFITTLRFVCWLNKKKMGLDVYDETTAKCIDAVLSAWIVGRSITSGGISRLFVSNPRILKQDAGIFAPYNYDEVETQYLRPPFEYFAIDLTCKYQVNARRC